MCPTALGFAATSGALVAGATPSIAATGAAIGGGAAAGTAAATAAALGTAAATAAALGTAGISTATALGAASLGLSGLGTLAQVGAQRAQSKAAQQRATFEAAVARNNQIIAEREAREALARGERRRQRRQIAGRQRIGRQRAQFAAQGIRIDEGSPLAVARATRRETARDTLEIQRQAEREALGFRTRAQNFGSQAALAPLRVPTSQTASTLLGDATTLATRAASFTSRGIFRNRQLRF